MFLPQPLLLNFGKKIALASRTDDRRRFVTFELVK